MDNYSSAVENSEKMAEKLKEAEEKTPPKLVRMTYREAKERYKDRLAIAASGMGQEGEEKWRRVIDGTNGIQVNTKISQTSMVPNPFVGDVAEVREECEEAS